MRIQYLGFIPAIILIIYIIYWLIKELIESGWEYSFLNMVILRFILTLGIFYIIGRGLFWASTGY